MEVKINSATVRIHNEPNQYRIKTATAEFLKSVQRQKKKGAINNGKEKSIHRDRS